MPARRRRLRAGDHVSGWAFVSPAVILIGLFGLVPVIWTFWLSFQETDLTSPGTFVGTAKYSKMVHDPLFWQSARETGLYTLMFVPLTMVLALPIAVLLNQRVRGMLFYRMAVYVPLVTSTVATGIIFSQLANPSWFADDPTLAWGFYGHRMNLYRSTQPHDGFTRRPGADDDVAELLRIAEPSDRIDLVLECRARRGRRLS